MREKLKIFRPEKGEKGEPETKIEKAGIEEKRKQKKKKRGKVEKVKRKYGRKRKYRKFIIQN